MSSEEKSVTESFKVHGDEAVKKVKELLREGNVRHITIANADGDTVMEIPLTVGIVGVALVPVAAAVGAITAMMTECTITVVRQEPEADAE